MTQVPWPGVGGALRGPLPTIFHFWECVGTLWPLSVKCNPQDIALQKSLCNDK